MSNTTAAEWRARSNADRLEATQAHDSFIVAVMTETQTVGTEWVKLEGFVLGPQNFDIAKGPDLQVCEDLDGIDVLSVGRYALNLNCQLSNPTGDGYFEPAVEPNGLSLSEGLWPAEIAQGHLPFWVNAAAVEWDGVDLGAAAGYTAPKLDPGALVTAWARFGSASGSETVDVMAILYATRITV